jgi:hypothetical protein
MYRRGRWKTLSGEYITAELPQNITGHFGLDLQAFVLYQHYGCYVTQPLILEQLSEIGVVKQMVSLLRLNIIALYSMIKFFRLPCKHRR